jgi:hypothetical protein
MDTYDKLIKLSHRLYEEGMRSTTDDVFYASMTLSKLLTDTSKAQIDEICGLPAETGLVTTDDAREAMRTINDAATAVGIDAFFANPSDMDDEAVMAADPYPLHSARWYSGYSASYATIMASLVTFATMDAAAMHATRASPLTKVFSLG